VTTSASNVKNLSVKDIKRGFVCSDSKIVPAVDTKMLIAQDIVLNHPARLRTARRSSSTTTPLKSITSSTRSAPRSTSVPTSPPKPSPPASRLKTPPYYNLSPRSLWSSRSSLPYLHSDASPSET
jgi:hypothetical protein